jgi:hypothetical protein
MRVNAQTTWGLWEVGFPCALGSKNGRKITGRALPQGAFFRPHTPSGGPCSPLQPSKTGNFFFERRPSGA